VLFGIAAGIPPAVFVYLRSLFICFPGLVFACEQFVFVNEHLLVFWRFLNGVNKSQKTIVVLLVLLPSLNPAIISVFLFNRTKKD